jgi:hypothetical protein
MEFSTIIVVSSSLLDCPAVLRERLAQAFSTLLDL